MAITSNTISVVEIPIIGNDWVVSLYSADIQGCEDIKAAAAGKCHYIKKLLIHTITAMNLTIGSGEGTSAVEAILIGPVPIAAGNFVYEIDFGRKGMKIPVGKAFTIDGSAAGAITIYAEGKTCQEIAAN